MQCGRCVTVRVTSKILEVSSRNYLPYLQVVVERSCCPRGLPTWVSGVPACDDDKTILGTARRFAQPLVFTVFTPGDAYPVILSRCILFRTFISVRHFLHHPAKPKSSISTAARVPHRNRTPPHRHHSTKLHVKRNTRRERAISRNPQHTECTYTRSGGSGRGSKSPK